MDICDACHQEMPSEPGQSNVYYEVLRGGARVTKSRWHHRCAPADVKEALRAAEHQQGENDARPAAA